MKNLEKRLNKLESDLKDISSRVMVLNVKIAELSHQLSIKTDSKKIVSDFFIVSGILSVVSFLIYFIYTLFLT